MTHYSQNEVKYFSKRKFSSAGGKNEEVNFYFCKCDISKSKAIKYQLSVFVHYSRCPRTKTEPA